MTSGFYYALCGLVAGGLYFLRNWSQGKRCEVFARLDGKIVVITGGNTGNFLDVYRTRAIITRGLYTFYPLFEVHLCTVTFGLMYG